MKNPISPKASDPCPKCGRVELRYHTKKRNMAPLVTCFSCHRTFYESDNGVFLETMGSRRASKELTTLDRTVLKGVEGRRRDGQKSE